MPPVCSIRAGPPVDIKTTGPCLQKARPQGEILDLSPPLPNRPAACTLHIVAPAHIPQLGLSLGCTLDSLPARPSWTPFKTLTGS